MSVVIPVTSFAGQGNVGQFVQVPWWPGSFEITQGWGPTDYSGEPEGHGYAHWHAGADVGADCGTVISLPHGVTGVARWLDNPGGYGTALRIEQPNGQDIDILFGHLRQRLVADGQALRGGEQLAISNNTGNSSGCHIHFEVRPHGGRYGTDIDPTSWLLSPEGATSPGGQAPGAPAGAPQTLSAGNPYNPLDPRSAIWEAEHSLGQAVTSATADLLGAGQVALGSTMMLGGLVMVGFGLRGETPAQLTARARRTLTTRGRRPAPVPAQSPEEAAGPSKAALDKDTLSKYRLGLISRQEAQRRLGEPVRATGRRPSRSALDTGFREPGVYRARGGSTVEVQRAQASRLRPNLQAAFERSLAAGRRPSPIKPSAPETPIPF